MQQKGRKIVAKVREYNGKRPHRKNGKTRKADGKVSPKVKYDNVSSENLDEVSEQLESIGLSTKFKG